jgi:flagellar basal-body rod protein FlgF
MNYGLYLAAGGTLSSMRRQDVLANNLANVNTAGFKPDEVYPRALLPQRVESNAIMANPQEMLERLGGGAFADRTHSSFRQGLLAQTKNDLDVALEGEGFFVVRGGADDQARLTRDGRFTRNGAGELVMASTGLRVLDVNNRAIRLNATEQIEIDAEGNVRQGDVIAGRLQIASVNKESLAKEGANLFRMNAEARRQPGSATVRQGYIEGSGVDPIMMLNKMINASKAVNANATMMQYHDHILGQAVNTFGRVA